MKIKNIVFIAVMQFPLLINQVSAMNEEIVDKLLEEFTPSTLSREQQKEEFMWFIKAAEPYRGMSINVVSETIDTHVYESKTMAKAFSELTGIKVTHELTGEDDVVNKISAQTQMGVSIYDGFINDSDLIGLHFRSGKIVNLTDYMQNEGKDVTLPNLDLDDFIGLSFTKGPDGNLYQLPDQQFANLYWYRADWFARPDLQAQFKSIYGYELGIPENWSAYEDIAEFFTEHVKELDGQRVYGHMDYGKKDPSLGWRFSDAWLSMAGAGDKGIPNGLPVDEWGIRVEDCHPVGASVARGGAVNGPAAVYAVTKFKEWLNKYAPPEAKDMTFSEAGAIPAQGYIAQQIFWYTAFTAAMTKPGLPVVNSDGTPKWRMAPSPRGAYWEKGMKLGYQDTGSWTFTKTTPKDRMAAAWLYAQFTVAKSTSLKKTIVGLTPIRQSDLSSDELQKRAKLYGGLIEFYNSPARIQWTPSGTNVPDYTKLANFWWKSISLTLSEGQSVQAAMDNLANNIDNTLIKIQERGSLQKCGPIVNAPSSPDVWLSGNTAPKPKLSNEKPTPITSTYEELLNKNWK